VNLVARAAGRASHKRDRRVTSARSLEDVLQHRPGTLAAHPRADDRQPVHSHVRTPGFIPEGARHIARQRPVAGRRLAPRRFRVYAASGTHGRKVSTSRICCQRTNLMPDPSKAKPATRLASRGRLTQAGLGFGESLRKARTAQGLTLRDLSTTSDVSIAYLSDLERGVLGNPTLDTLRAIAKALNVSLNSLLDVDENPRSPTRYPAALEEFRSFPTFREVVLEDAKRRSRDPHELEDEWVRTLADIQVGGRRPRTPSDYLFIFEAIRRAVDRR